jgi:hypothetical protein
MLPQPVRLHGQVPKREAGELKADETIDDDREERMQPMIPSQEE